MGWTADGQDSRAGGGGGLAGELLELASGEAGVEAAVARLAEAPLDRQVAAIEALVRSRDSAAAGLLLAASETLQDRRARKEARRALHRLRDAGVAAPTPAARPPAQLPGLGLFQLSEARASISDGVGSRSLSMHAQRPDGSGLMLVFLLNDQVGVKDCDLYPASARRFRERMADYQERASVTLVPLPAAYARQLVGEALELNRSAEFPVPPGVERYERAVEAPHAPFERALIYEELSEAEAQLLPELVERTPELLDVEELRGWFFGFDEVLRYAQDMAQARQSRIVLAPELKERRELDILQAAIRDLVTEPVRHALQRRLEEAAYVFLRLEQREHARLALAAAVRLREGALTLHPWLLATMGRSVELAIEAQAANIPASALRRSARDPV